MTRTVHRDPPPHPGDRSCRRNCRKDRVCDRTTTHRTRRCTKVRPNVSDIKHDNGNLIVLHRTDQTTADGIYNLWFEHGG